MDNKVTLKQTDKGALPERMRHSRLAVGVAEINKGGHAIAYHHQDTEHCLLDRMYNAGFIGLEQCEQGLKLRALYYEFNQTGISYEDMGGHKDSFTKESEIGRGKDLDEWLYNKTLTNIQEPYRSAARRLCVFDEWSDLRAMQIGLSKLYSAFYEAEKALNDLKRTLEQKDNK